MKKIIKRTLGLASLALLSASAFGGIDTTPHNLTSTGPGPNKQTTTAQICVFCHTPHASNTGVSAPLWNKGTSTATYQQYTTANSSTIDGQVLAVGSVSAACLSCHDGTQAMDNLVNAPGSGGLVTGGSNQNYTWTVGSEKISATSVANLGSDLRNDHPIGIEYCGGGLSNGGGTTLSGSCTDTDFKTPNTDVINGTPVFWVDSSNNSTRGKGDIILYSRTFSAGANQPSVECASCHDPHQAKGTDDVNFMRVTTAQSKICLACHSK